MSPIQEFNSDTSTSDDHTAHADVDAGGVNDDVGNFNNDVSDVNNNTGDTNNDAGDVHNDAGDYHDDAGDVHNDAGVIDDDVGNVDDSTQPFLNNDHDVLELIIKITLSTFPFMRSSLKRVNRFSKVTVDNVPCPRVYIPELPERNKRLSASAKSSC